MIVNSAVLVAAAVLAGSADVPSPTFANTAPRAALIGERGPAAPLPVSARLKAVAALSGASSRAALTQLAVTLLSDDVEQLSHPDALRLAFQAYYNFKESRPWMVRNPYLYFVDYGLDTRTPRGYVFDMEAMMLVEGPFNVAHGRGSVLDGGDVPTRFSNTLGSNATSLGLYLTQETYAFRGTSSGQSYRSVGLRLAGLSGQYNSGARTRGVVVHGAPYVTAEKAGRSEGCPAMEQERAERLIPQISNGGLVFLFSPLDPEWMRTEMRSAGL